MMPQWTRPLQLALLALLCSALVVGIWLTPDLDRAFVAETVARIGPAAIVLLVALGIVVSPIPSGAIALAAGALYGPLWGGALTIAGAGLGAACAFALSRFLGRGVLMASQSVVAQFLTRERSQQALMLAVFGSRLVPFISFDAVSYVAGLTPLRFWRFLVATVLGTAPVCMAFALAGHHASAAANPLLLALACGITLLGPAVVILSRGRRWGGWRAAQG